MEGACNIGLRLVIYWTAVTVIELPFATKAVTYQPMTVRKLKMRSGRNAKRHQSEIAKTKQTTFEIQGAEVGGKKQRERRLARRPIVGPRLCRTSCRWPALRHDSPIEWRENLRGERTSKVLEVDSKEGRGWGCKDVLIRSY